MTVTNRRWSQMLILLFTSKKYKYYSIRKDRARAQNHIVGIL